MVLIWDCTEVLHRLGCGHTITSKGRTPCGQNCASPFDSPKQHSYVCRYCRSDADLKLLLALRMLGQKIYLFDPKSGDPSTSDGSFVSLHDPKLANGYVHRLNDKLAGRKVWFPFVPVFRSERSEMAYAPRFVLMSAWDRFIGGTTFPMLGEMTIAEAKSLIQEAISAFESRTQEGRKVIVRAKTQATLVGAPRRMNFDSH